MSESQRMLSHPLSGARALAAPRVQTGRAEGVAVLVVVLLLPLALFALHAAPALRVVYPLGNLLLAAWLYARRSPWYVAHTLLVFCCVSLVRRLVDEQAGFDAVNPVLFTPYLCAACAGIGFLEYWLRPRPAYLGAFLLLVLCPVYGGVLAALDGRAIAGTVDTLKWITGPLFAVYALTQARGHAGGAELRGLLENCLIAAATAMSLYGALQFIQPPSWDALWMREVAELGMESIGVPEPYSLRVFSTMNSPGSLGAILLAGIIIASKRRPAVAIPTVGCMLVGLGLCQYRTIWVATALALLLLVCMRPGVLKPRNLLAAAAVLLALSSSALVPEIRESITRRASTMWDLRSDRSGEERLEQYRNLASEDGLVLGRGLGQGGAVRRLDGLPRGIIDSGLLDSWRALGVVVGSAFLGALALLLARACTRAAPAAAGDVVYDRIVALTAFVQLPMGSVHVGELGFCAWLFLGLALAARAGGDGR